MDRTFTLPIALAAALHAALLFGFPKTPRVVMPKGQPTTIIPYKFVLPEPESLANADAESGSEAAPPARPVPMSPEPPVVDVREAFTMPRQNIEPFSPTDVSVIPNTVRNLFHGDGEEITRTQVLPGTALDNAPRTRFQPAPVYPSEGRREGLRGEVFVEFLVDEAGRVVDPRVVHSSNRMFEEPTLRAVSRWQFEPGRRAGRVVRFKMAVPVIFNLNE